MIGFRAKPSTDVGPYHQDSDGTGKAGELDLRSEAKRLFGTLNLGLEQGSGLVLQFIAASQGEGVSTIAREFAIVASEYTHGPVALLDFDGEQAGHERYFQGQRQLERFGPLRIFEGWEVDTSLLMRTAHNQPPCRMEFRSVGDTSLVLGKLTGNPCKAVYAPTAGKFWTTLRQQAVLTVVDSSSSPTCLDGANICGSMDAVIIVVAAEETRSPVVQALYEKLRDQDAPVIGTILNKRRYYIPAFIYRWLDYL